MVASQNHLSRVSRNSSVKTQKYCFRIFIDSSPQMVKDDLDLVLIDEAHRIEKTSNFQYTKSTDKTDMPQIDQLIRCAKTTVFFIDDKQFVRSQEIGNHNCFKTSCKKFDCHFRSRIPETQYRCMGSNDYLLWLESVLGYSDRKRILQKNEIFNLKFLDPRKRCITLN